MSHPIIRLIDVVCQARNLGRYNVLQVGVSTNNFPSVLYVNVYRYRVLDRNLTIHIVLISCYEWRPFQPSSIFKE
jgi:hypothetical protein